MHAICTSTPAAPFMRTLVCTCLHPPTHVPCAPPWHPVRSFVAVLATTRAMRRLQLITRQIRDRDKRIINPRTSKCLALALALSLSLALALALALA